MTYHYRLHGHALSTILLVMLYDGVYPLVRGVDFGFNDRLQLFVIGMFVFGKHNCRTSIWTGLQLNDN